MGSACFEPATSAISRRVPWRLFWRFPLSLHFFLQLCRQTRRRQRKQAPLRTQFDICRLAVLQALRTCEATGSLGSCNRFCAAERDFAAMNFEQLVAIMRTHRVGRVQSACPLPPPLRRLKLRALPSCLFFTPYLFVCWAEHNQLTF